jgi:hypothetical protein
LFALEGVTDMGGALPGPGSAGPAVPVDSVTADRLALAGELVCNADAGAVAALD